MNIPSTEPATRNDDRTAQELPATMRAMPFEGYGSAAWKPVDVALPDLEPDRFLVEVRAASINPADLHMLGGSLVTRALSGFKKPSNPAPGSDVAGVVVRVGSAASGFRVGDEVFGGARGSLAGFASAKVLARKPARLTFEQAAAIPIAGLTALQGLRDKGRLQPGSRVLINGAAGGVGTFAVQIAKALGGEVTAVCGPGNGELVRSLGADRVFDYTREDFAQSGERYDLVFDVVGNRSLRDLRRVLTPNGTLVLAGGGHQDGHGKNMLRALSKIGWSMMVRRFIKGRIAFFIAQFNPEDLATLAKLVDEGKLMPCIDRTFPLDQTAEAFRYLATGHAKAKIVITTS